MSGITDKIEDTLGMGGDRKSQDQGQQAAGDRNQGAQEQGGSSNDVVLTFSKDGGVTFSGDGVSPEASNRNYRVGTVLGKPAIADADRAGNNTTTS